MKARKAAESTVSRSWYGSCRATATAPDRVSRAASRTAGTVLLMPRPYTAAPAEPSIAVPRAPSSS
ncbi:hypothetical protein ACFWNT_33335 [Streptomyces sp. NPDC058409]|uniref:hypothetical protein n=1 Tax=Streptomyces sp. NPDC058409 TaxID=3346484 RepID=UPI00364D0A8D